MRQPLLRECAHADCRTLTMGTHGALCIRHDLSLPGAFARGRPYVVRGTVLTRSTPASEETVRVLALSAKPHR